jgi:hypothetical protein
MENGLELLFDLFFHIGGLKSRKAICGGES